MLAELSKDRKYTIQHVELYVASHGGISTLHHRLQAVKHLQRMSMALARVLFA